MAEITMLDLKDTFIRLTKDAPVYTTPWNGDKGAPIWWTKKKGELAGKVFMWISPSAPMQFGGIQNSYLIFKVNDDFYNPNAVWYFIRFDKGMIDWDYSKKQLAAKQYADMSLWEKFTQNMEASVKEWKDGVVKDVKNGLVTGLSIVAGVLLLRFVVIPYTQYRVLKSTARDLIKEAKRS